MKFVFFVEGYTEQKALPKLLRSWLNPRLNERIGIDVVRCEGCAELLKDLRKRVRLYLESPNGRDIIAVVALLDLYGPDILPRGLTSVEERVRWATSRYLEQVSDQRFRMFFAVHEIEAWLLSDPTHLPPTVQHALLGKARQPETVDFDTPPSKLLDRLYRQAENRAYSKLRDGATLFGRLSAETVYEKCPHFREMMDDLLTLATQAGMG